MIIYNLTNKRT